MIQQEVFTFFKDLLRIDIMNSFGNECFVVDLFVEFLCEDGIEFWIVESVFGCANFVVRLLANCESNFEFLLFVGYIDVVFVNVDEWMYFFFVVVEVDEMIWGCGVVDMKNMVVMSVMVIKVFVCHFEFLCHCDLIFVVVVDEEEGCAMGLIWLVENYFECVKVEFMLGEVGGFWLNIGVKMYVLIMVVEKGCVYLRMCV